VIPELVLHHTPEFHRFPKFVALQVHGFESLRIRDFEASRVQNPDVARSRPRDFAGSRFHTIARSRLRDFESSRFQTTARSRLRDFGSSRFQIFASSLLLKTYFTNFINLDVSRVTGFPEFPSTIHLIQEPIKLHAMSPYI
jgi:hypothetical protein